MIWEFSTPMKKILWWHHVSNMGFHLITNMRYSMEATTPWFNKCMANQKVLKWERKWKQCLSPKKQNHGEASHSFAPRKRQDCFYSEALFFSGNGAEGPDKNYDEIFEENFQKRLANLWNMNMTHFIEKCFFTSEAGERAGSHRTW